MKKILIIFALFGFAQLSAQAKKQTLIIVNDSDYNLLVGTFNTCSNLAVIGDPVTYYPLVASVESVTLSPGESFILENSSPALRFPFESPSSIPYLTQWRRHSAPGVPHVVVSSPSIFLTTGASQQFYNLKFGVTDVSDNWTGGGNIGSSVLGMEDFITDYSSSLWQIMYFENTISATEKECVVYLANM